MPNKLTIEEMQQIAKTRGGKCLSSKYVNAHAKLIWECSEGHRWKATGGSIKNSKTWCRKCAGKEPLTIGEMQELAKSRGGICLSSTIANSQEKLTWMCSEGHTWKATGNSIKNSKTWCRKCAGKESFTIEEMQKLAYERNGRCLSKDYSYKRKLEWECRQKHRWWATAKSVRQGRWCKKCSHITGGKKQRLKASEFLSRALDVHKNIYKYDMETYKGRMHPVDIICSKHGRFSQIAQNHLSGNGCKFCVAKGEAEIKRIIEKLGFEVRTQEPIKNRKFDFYLPNLNLMIERDGEQHYRAAWEGLDGFNKQQEIDREKTILAIHNGFKLARIPFWVKNENEIIIEIKNIVEGKPTYPIVPDIEQLKFEPKPDSS